MTESIYNGITGVTLNGSISSGVLSLIVSSAAGFPTPNFRIKIDNEIMLVTNAVGTTFTVTRGVEGTTAASHSSGATVWAVLTAGALYAAFSSVTGPTGPSVTGPTGSASTVTGPTGPAGTGATGPTGPVDIPQNSKSSDWTTVMSDDGGQIFHPTADATPRTWTIDSNVNVPYPIGANITFINEDGAGVITIAITSDTLLWAPSGGTGSRTLAPSGCATAVKITTIKWMITGVGLT